MNLYQFKLTDNQKAALEHLFAQGIIWSKTELSEAWDELREQVKEATNTVAIINAIHEAKCNCTKASAPAPKYDSRRKFRKGDKVRVVEWNGRCPQCEGLLGQITTVLRDEKYFGVRIQIGESGESYCTPEPCFLELVTPVEDLGRYVVRHNEAHSAWSIYGPFNLSAANYFYGERYPYTKETAKKAAEDERDRLNAEWRKEKAHENQEN